MLLLGPDNPRYCSFMLAKLNTYALVGIDAVPVEVEVDAAAGFPKIIIVGLPEQAVRESVHRIERCLSNLRYDRPHGRTVINLRPQTYRRPLERLILPIALGILVATGQILPEKIADCASVGELALDGSIRPVKGALSMAMGAKAAGVGRLIVPAGQCPRSGGRRGRRRLWRRQSWAKPSACSRARSASSR